MNARALVLRGFLHYCCGSLKCARNSDGRPDFVRRDQRHRGGAPGHYGAAPGHQGGTPRIASVRQELALAVRHMTIRTGSMMAVLLIVLVAIKFFE
jgi:hypothetical protein